MCVNFIDLLCREAFDWIYSAGMAECCVVCVCVCVHIYPSLWSLVSCSAGLSYWKNKWCDTVWTPLWDVNMLTSGFINYLIMNRSCSVPLRGEAVDSLLICVLITGALWCGRPLSFSLSACIFSTYYINAVNTGTITSGGDMCVAFESVWSRQWACVGCSMCRGLCILHLFVKEIYQSIYLSI